MLMTQGPRGSEFKKQLLLRATTVAIVLFSASFLLSPAAMAQDSSANINTGDLSNSTVGDNNFQATDTGVAINGDAGASNINNNQNNLTTGHNTNSNNLYNIAQPRITSTTNAALNSNPTLYAPSAGGNSALVLPRNPLALPNAALGRSNFGLQFGLQNNPSLTGGSGGAGGLGWFLQGGLSIPFGKIPEPFRNQAYNQLDELRIKNFDSDRNVFARPLVDDAYVTNAAQNTVKGRVVGLNAYNLSAVPTGKITPPVLPTPPTGFDFNAKDGETKAFQPKLLALSTGEVFTRPLETGEKIGAIELGREYPYLGHIRASADKPGWIKVLMPNGAEGWTSTRFEFIKYDYTEIDALAVSPPATPKIEKEKTAMAVPSHRPTSTKRRRVSMGRTGSRAARVR